jgi:cobalt-zinc-cadmium efflux system membrane fusion protein
MTKKRKLSLAFAAAAISIVGVAFALIDRPSALRDAADVSESKEAKHDDEQGEGGVVEMTATERAAKGIKTATVESRMLADEIVVPGEITLDLYRSAKITPRIAAQVVKRHAKLGDKVRSGQSLVTLTSVEMARAQGELIVATQEWERVRKLGRDVVSERRYVEARVAAEHARAKVLAFGMTPDQVTVLVETGDASKAAGTFELLALQDGTIVKDDFVIGEVVEPGRVLFEIIDESRVWVEAQLTPDQAAHVEVGAPVRILIDDSHAVDGRVVQTHHTLDETTRTRPVRIQVDNRADELHPGQFVNVALEIGDSKPALTVPEPAVILMNGSPKVFKVEGDKLYPTPIEIGMRRADWVEIKNGLKVEDEIVISKVFLLKSLIQKSQMGGTHGR